MCLSGDNHSLFLSQQAGSVKQHKRVSNFVYYREGSDSRIKNSLRNMWNEIELLTSDDTGSGYLGVGSRKEHGTALYQVDLLAKISSEKVMILMLLFTEFY